MGKGIIALLGLGLGAAALLIALTKGAKAAEPELITVSDIMSAQSIAELDAFYELMNELYITEQITVEEYQSLYEAYHNRWYELTEAE